MEADRMVVELSKKAAVPVTTVWDGVSIFVNVKPLDIRRRPLDKQILRVCVAHNMIFSP